MFLPQVSMAETHGLFAFEYRSGDGPQDAIALSKEDGKDFRVLVSRGTNPVWFPNGQLIAYFDKSKSIDPNSEMYGSGVIVDLHGNEQIRIPYLILDVSNDGGRLLTRKYLGPKGGNKNSSKALYEIGLYDLKSNSYRRILSPFDFPPMSGFVTPIDGRFRGVDDSKVIFSIDSNDMMWSNSFGEYDIVSSTYETMEFPSTEYSISPALRSFDISPDGNILCITAFPNPNLHNSRLTPSIFLWDFKNGSVKRIYSEYGNTPLSNPSWSPDGSSVVVDFFLAGGEFSSGEASLQVINVNDGGRRYVFNDNPLNRLRIWVGLTVDGAKRNAAWWKPIRP